MIKIKMMLGLCLVGGLSACATPHTRQTTALLSPAQIVNLEQGKRYFTEGSYRHALHTLLPLACEGNREAQYAIGYLYYYGYGVTEDKETGLFWIDRAARQDYLPAMQARRLIGS